MCIPPPENVFLIRFAGCREKVPISLSPRDGHTPCTSVLSPMRAAVLLKQGDMYSSPEPHWSGSHGSASDTEVLVPRWDS